MPATNIAITATDKTKAAFGAVKKSVSGLTSSVVSLQGALGGIGLALGVRAFVNFTKESLKLADGIGKMSDRLNISTTALQTFRFAGEQAGESFESMDNNLVKFVRNLGDGQKGVTTITDEFERLNIELKDQNGNWKDHESILNEVADRYKEMKDPADKLSSAMTLFGRGGRVMVNMLSEGSEGLAELRGELVESGGIIRESLIRNSEDANDAVNKLSHTIQTTLMHALSDMAPSIETAADGLQALLIPAKKVTGTGSTIFGIDNLMKALIGLRYAFSVVRIVAGTSFDIMVENFKTAGTWVTWLASSVIAILGGAFTHVRNLVAPMINVIIKGINKILSFAGKDGIKLIDEKQVNIGKALDKINKETVKDLNVIRDRKRELILIGNQQLEVEKQTLGIRAKAYLESQIALPPAKLMKEMEGEADEGKPKVVKETEEKINAVIKYKSVFTEAFAEMANSVTNLSDKEKELNAQRIDQALSTSQQMIHSMKGFNKSWFDASKALSIAETIMTTYAAATKALLVQPPPVGIAFAATITALGMANVARIKKQKYQGKASGGRVSAGQTYVVGEKGPEVLTMGQGGNITPNESLGGVTNINFNIRANDASGFDSMLMNRRGMIVAMINQALHNRGRRGMV